MKGVKKMITLCFTLMVLQVTTEALAFNIPAPEQHGEALRRGFETGSNHGARLHQQQNERRRMQIEQQRFQLEQERSLYQQRLWDAQMELIEKEKDPAKKLAYMQSLLKSMNSSQ